MSGNGDDPFELTTAAAEADPKRVEQGDRERSRESINLARLWQAALREDMQ
jgi:hypothetical protein